jgi:hypothetical protein
VIIEDRIREWEAGQSSSALFCPAANSVAQIPALDLMAFQAISNRNLTMQRASASRPSAPWRTTRGLPAVAGICSAISNREPQLPARLTHVALQENSRASQFNGVTPANQPIPSHKTRGRERETWQIKSPNSVIRTCSNSLKTNDGDMLKSPKNQILQDHELRASGSIHGPRIADRGSLLTGSALQTEFGLTYRKQTTEKFLTGARTHIRQTRFCAKMSVETNEEMSEEMKAIR